MKNTLTVFVITFVLTSICNTTWADTVTTTGDKITLTNTYKPDGSRQVIVNGGTFWVPSPSTLENKLIGASGNACCKVTITYNNNRQITRVTVKCRIHRKAVPKRDCDEIPGIFDAQERAHRNDWVEHSPVPVINDAVASPRACLVGPGPQAGLPGPAASPLDSLPTA